MANMVIVDGKYLLSDEATGAGTITHTLATENHFVDKDIDIEISVAAGALGTGTGSAEASSDISGLLGTASSTQPSTGHYVKAEGAANVAVSTSGWLDSGDDVDVSIADVYYPITEASQTITGGALSEGAKSVAINSDGAYNGSSYDTSDKIKFEAGEAAGVYKIHPSGSATVNRAAVTKQVTQDGYIPADATAQTAISADSATVNIPETGYYIKKSSISASSVTPSTVAQTVTVTEGYAPEDRTITIQPMAPGSASSSFANTGLGDFFNAGTSADHDVVVTPQYSIDVAGYFAQTANPVDGTPAYYSIKAQTVTETTTTVSGTTANRGTRTESAGWKASAETLDVATFKNALGSGETDDYVDISATTAAPVLVENGYLYITEGWTDKVKISLAKLVPDGTDIHGHTEYILTGHTARDDDGSLITGSMPIYAGAYDVT